MTKYKLTSKLISISNIYQNAEAELYKFDAVWSFLCENYKGNPLQNLDELLNNESDMKKLFEIMRIKS